MQSIHSNKQNKILQKISKTEINQLAGKYVLPDKMVIVVVGDKAKVYDSIVKLGYKVTELMADGRPIDWNLKSKSK